MTALWISDFDDHPEIGRGVVLTSIINYNALAEKFITKGDVSGKELISELNLKLIELAHHIDKNYIKK